MTGDVRQRLGEALDQAEQRARDLLVHAQRTSLMLKEPRLLGLQIPGWHDWPDVEAMCARELRLIERDRALIETFEAIKASPAIHADAWIVLRGELNRAAAFWLGTPEVDR